MSSMQLFLFAALLLSPACQAHPHTAVHSHPHGEKWEQPKEPSPPIILGQAPWRYQYMPELLTLPAEVNMANGHGLARDSNGNIYFTYESATVTAATRVLVKFPPSGMGPGQLLGPDNELAYGTPHGLRLSVESDGNEYLYHANNDMKIFKTYLNGTVIWRNNNAIPQQYSPYHPTDALSGTPPGQGATVFVGDGYGSSYVHLLDASSGKYLRTFGGEGSAYGKFNCDHGISIDPRPVAPSPLLISNRGNSRLDYFTYNGTYVSTVTAPNGTVPSPIPDLPQPCNVNYNYPTSSMAVVPDLSGMVGILDASNSLVSLLNISGSPLGQVGYLHPHDAILLENGDVVVCFWNPGRLSYWKKLDN